MDMFTPILPKQEGPIAYDWHNGEVYPGDDIYTLADGTIVPADTDEMKAYIKYRIRKLGLNNWVKYELGEGRVDDFIISLTIDHLSLEELFESYYDADRSNAGEAV